MKIPVFEGMFNVRTLISLFKFRICTTPQENTFIESILFGYSIHAFQRHPIIIYSKTLLMLDSLRTSSISKKIVPRKDITVSMKKKNTLTNTFHRQIASTTYNTQVHCPKHHRRITTVHKYGIVPAEFLCKHHKTTEAVAYHFHLQMQV